jgi:hypothetical protein
MVRWIDESSTGATSTVTTGVASTSSLWRQLTDTAAHATTITIGTLIVRLT